MKKIGGFKLRRKLVRIWRLMRRPLRRRTAYRRLAALPPPSPSHSPPRRHHDRDGADMSTVVAILGRCLGGRLCHAPRLSFGGTDGGDAHGHGSHGNKQQPQTKPPPKGHLVVYVGRKGVDTVYRVPVPVVYLNHPLFGELLGRAEEEFGFHQAGGIAIPCPMAEFESVRTRVASAAGVSCRHRGTAVGAVAVGDGDGSWCGARLDDDGEGKLPQAPSNVKHVQHARVHNFPYS